MMAIEERNHVYQELVDETGIDPFDCYSPSSTEVRQANDKYRLVKRELGLLSTDPRYSVYYQDPEVHQDGV